MSKRRAVALEDRGIMVAKTVTSDAVSESGKLAPAKAPGTILVEDPDPRKPKRPDDEEEVEKQAMTPPATVAAQAALGLKLRGEFDRGGTAVGVARARDLMNRRPVTQDTLERMRSFFARHGAQVDRRDEGWENEKNPSAQWIAWLLWGGDPGRDWAEKLEPVEKRVPDEIDPEGLQPTELLVIHDRLHVFMRSKTLDFSSVKATVAEIVNMHARVVGRLSTLGYPHPPPPYDGLDSFSHDFEAVHKGIESDTDPGGIVDREEQYKAAAESLWEESNVVD